MESTESFSQTVNTKVYLFSPKSPSFVERGQVEKITSSKKGSRADTITNKKEKEARDKP